MKKIIIVAICLIYNIKSNGNSNPPIDTLNTKQNKLEQPPNVLEISSTLDSVNACASAINVVMLAVNNLEDSVLCNLKNIVENTSLTHTQKINAISTDPMFTSIGYVLSAQKTNLLSNNFNSPSIKYNIALKPQLKGLFINAPCGNCQDYCDKIDKCIDTQIECVALATLTLDAWGLLECAYNAWKCGRDADKAHPNCASLMNPPVNPNTIYDHDCN